MFVAWIDDDRLLRANEDSIALIGVCNGPFSIWLVLPIGVAAEGRCVRLPLVTVTYLSHNIGRLKNAPLDQQTLLIECWRANRRTERTQLSRSAPSTNQQPKHDQARERGAHLLCRLTTCSLIVNIRILWALGVVIVHRVPHSPHRAPWKKCNQIWWRRCAMVAMMLMVMHKVSALSDDKQSVMNATKTKHQRLSF